jgi:hypothetical protein
LPILLVALSFAANAAWLSTAAIEMRNATDSASLAATHQLISDEWLRQPKSGIPTLINTVGTTAVSFAGQNRVLGAPLEIIVADTNPDFVPDFVLGGYDPTTAIFTPAPLPVTNGLTLAQADAISITGRRITQRNTGIPVILGSMALRSRWDLQGTTLARLDRDVYGFRAEVGLNIPLVPIGVLSDPNAVNPLSWENQTIVGTGADTNLDAIDEIVVSIQLAPNGNPAASNGCLLTIGTTPIATQVTAGISVTDLPPNGILALDPLPLNTVQYPGTGLGPALATPPLTNLETALNTLQSTNAVRIWPLVLDCTPPPGGASINAFIAARVLTVQTIAGPPDLLRIRLQPAMLSVPRMLTDPARRNLAHLVPSPYLGRTRIVR